MTAQDTSAAALTAVAAGRSCPAPATLPVSLGPSTQIRAAGRVLAGGMPMRLVSLTNTGARVAFRWRMPSPVGEDPGARRLARRLLEAEILTPQPLPAPSTAELSVVVPVRDRPAELPRCLEAIGRACRQSPVVVVDDGSARPEPVRAICAELGAHLVRHDMARGPAAARNAGLAACSTPLVGFVDSDVVLPATSAGRLLGHLSDPALGAVAPRVRGLPPARGRIAGYEARHSALDMGSRGGLVAPGRQVSYVPGAVIFARRDAIGDGFDESLWIGEDVDLVWRMGRAGWRVRYAPEVEVWHRHRVRLIDFTTDRRRYARSLGELSRRHPGAAPAMWVTPGLALTWGLALSGQRRGALMCAAWSTLRCRRKLRRLPISPTPIAVSAVTRGLGATGVALAHGVRHAWTPPLLALSWRRPRLAALVAAAFMLPVVQDTLAAEDPHAIASDAALRLLAEIAALAGTWEGCVRARTIRPLVPALPALGGVPA